MKIKNELGAFIATAAFYALFWIFLVFAIGVSESLLLTSGEYYLPPNELFNSNYVAIFTIFVPIVVASFIVTIFQNRLLHFILQIITSKKIPYSEFRKITEN